MKITLIPDIECALTERAHRQGTTPEILALESLRKQFVPTAPSDDQTMTQGTLADFLADHLGVISSSEHVPGGANMSQRDLKPH
jgi:hypothetical protein